MKKSYDTPLMSLLLVPNEDILSSSGEVTANEGTLISSAIPGEMWEG